MPTFPNYPSGQPAAQTLLQYADPAGCPENFISLANIVAGPKLTFKVREVDTTAHPTAQTSSATIAATFVPTIREANLTFDVELKTDTAQYDALNQFAQQSTFLNWRIVDADSKLTVTAFAGFITQYDIDRAVTTVVKATMTVRVSGDIEYRA